MVAKKNDASKTKRFKINEAQKTMLMGVFGASIVLGAALVAIIYFVKYINFNNKVITEKTEAIVNYSKTISNTGTCKKPKSKDGVYTLDELKKCHPDDIEAADVPGSLRNNILVNMASNVNLETVARNSLSVCINPDSGENYTYKELNDMYEGASNDEERIYYFGMVKLCSALRVIPDALPTTKNEEALMSSLNKIFILSDWAPESLRPIDDSGSSDIAGLNTMPLALSVDGDIAVTLKVISNIEKSIRAFTIDTANIKWSGELNGADQLELTARAKAYYVNQSQFKETKKTVSAKENAKKDKKGTNTNEK